MKTKRGLLLLGLALALPLAAPVRAQSPLNEELRRTLQSLERTTMELESMLSSPRLLWSADLPLSRQNCCMDLATRLQRDQRQAGDLLSAISRDPAWSRLSGAGGAFDDLVRGTTELLGAAEQIVRYGSQERVREGIRPMLTDFSRLDGLLTELSRERLPAAWHVMQFDMHTGPNYPEDPYGAYPGQTVTYTVIISDRDGGSPPIVAPVTVSLLSSHPSIIQVPASIQITGPMPEEKFEVTVGETLSEVIVELRAAVEGHSPEGALTVQTPVRPGPPNLCSPTTASVAFDGSAHQGGLPVPVTITLPCAPPGSVQVQLQTDKPDVLIVPSLIMITEEDQLTLSLASNEVDASESVRLRVLSVGSSVVIGPWVTVTIF